MHQQKLAAWKLLYLKRFYSAGTTGTILSD